MLSKFKFFSRQDYPGCDCDFTTDKNLENLARIAESKPECIGFNTVGFFKHYVDLNLLKPSPYFAEKDGLYIDMERYSKLGEENKILHRLAEKYHLDKIISRNHNYIQTYEKLFETRRKSTRKVLEIGIGCVEKGQMLHMVNHGYKTGNSLRMWRDYFTGAEIYGIDIFPEAIFTEDRIHTFIADQSKVESLENVIKKIGENVDIIIDDGSHILQHQVLSFTVLEKYLTRHGVYVIEDIRSDNKEGYISLSHFPEDVREHIRKNYNVTVVDTRGSHNSHDDIMCIFERKYPIVYVDGTAGLANNLFQLFVAIRYAERYHAKILLNSASYVLKYGTANKFGRNVVRKGESYLDNIFNKLDTVYGVDYNSYKLISNDDKSVNTVEMSDDDVYCIHNYSQNIELFIEYLSKLEKYINLADPKIVEYVRNKYQVDPKKKNIMVGIRAGQDSGAFIIDKAEYTRAFERLIKPGEQYQIYVVSDVKQGWENSIDDKYLPNAVLVDEDDIAQIYLGLECNNIISSGSTYHYIIGLLAYIRDPSVNVVVFGCSELAKRKFIHLFRDWIIV